MNGTKLHLFLNAERATKVEFHRSRSEKLSKTEVTINQIVYSMIDIADALMQANLSKEELIALINRECK